MQLGPATFICLMCVMQGCADPSAAFGLNAGTPGGQVPEEPPKIKVVVRKRPISRKVSAAGHLPCNLPTNTHTQPPCTMLCRKRRKGMRTS